MQTDHIAHIQQVGEVLDLGSVAQRQFAFDIIEIDVHPQRFSQNTQLRTDVPVTDDPQFFATRFKTAYRQLVPHAAVRFRVSFRYAAQHQQQFANDQLGNGAGI